MGFLLRLVSLVPCLIAGVRAADLAGSLVPISSGLPLPPPYPSPLPSNSSSTPLLTFDDIFQQITCEPATFNWTYTDSANQQLIISIVTVRDNSVTTATTAPIINRVLSSTVNPKLDTYTWPAVDVPEGWYELYATVPARSFNTNSKHFFVKTGSNVSCMVSSSSSSSTSSSRPSTNIGAVIGGLVGGTMLLLGVAIILLLYRRRRFKKVERNVYPADNKRGGKSQFLSTRPTNSWDNLGSEDSHVAAVAAVKDSYSSQRLHRHPISQSSLTDSVNLPVLEYGRGRNLSQKSFNGVEKERNPSSPRGSELYKFPLTDGPRSRRPSDANSLAASSALSHVTGPPAIPEVDPPYYRSPSPTQTASEAGNALDLARSSSQQTRPHKSRKATRKPVPTYDPTTEAFSSSSPPALDAVNTLQATDDPFARPLPAALVRQDSTTSFEFFGGFSSSPSSAHGHGHYISRSQSNSSRKDRGLTHKGSFGFEGRPMHYLIPDMPPPPSKNPNKNG